MDIEKQVATLEQSKRLKELGVEIDSYFAWIILSGRNGEPRWTVVDKMYGSKFPAPTAVEIENLLPSLITVQNDSSVNLLIFKHEDFYCCGYSGLRIVQRETLTQALAQMLIWLIENNHINPKELNGR